MIYSSWQGTVKSIGEQIISEMNTPVDMYDIERDSPPEIPYTDYDCFIIGCSVHHGHIQDSIQAFLKNQCRPERKGVRALFCCAMKGNTATKEVLSGDIPQAIMDNFSTIGLMSGKTYYKKLSFVERRLLKQQSFDEHSMTTLNDIKVRKFAAEVLLSYREFAYEREQAQKHEGRIHYKAKKIRPEE